MPLSTNAINPLIFKPKAFIQQAVGVAAADLVLIEDVNHITLVADQTMYLGMDRDAVIPVLGTAEDDLLLLPAGSTRTIYVGDVSRISAIAGVAGTLLMQEVIDV